MFNIIFIYLFILYFVEYTSARGPSDYCNNIESPSPYAINLNEIGNSDIRVNSKFIQSLVPPPVVNKNGLIYF